MRPDLSSCIPNDTEIIFASRCPPPADWKDGKSKWLVCKRSGRAAQMNIAAAAAKGRFLWFVHADTRLPDDAEEKLSRAIAVKPLALHYFDLNFYDGGWRMALNGWGVRLRCAFFNNPFGDQAFCVSREVLKNPAVFPKMRLTAKTTCLFCKPPATAHGPTVSVLPLVLVPAVISPTAG